MRRKVRKKGRYVEATEKGKYEGSSLKFLYCVNFEDGSTQKKVEGKSLYALDEDLPREVKNKLVSHLSCAR